ncbi:nitronate monooxygenase family protein [Flavihumibacter sp. ZG627]|uniref:NAD(P)H-dependent flavin oxidoreductase n=1 Tax=Flavihumibacter sp. ZG627 TaxID=1463156 RepID=UPI00057E9BB7|nr:nitronate monooxygenase [Flavihumibacter sp. ZG627]KIC89087.1 2-nitropropane dioxygenase [Flavihumibacter sp. ZG627]
MFQKNIVSDLLKIQYPVLQGPFGGGLSSAELVAAVSNAGGLGGYGAYQLKPDEIVSVVRHIKELTIRPFNINLWVNDTDDKAGNLSDAEYNTIADLFRPYFDELHIPLPDKPGNVNSKFEEQVEALLRLRPAIFSFVFGIPSREILDECRKQGITTIGAATTLDEGLALEEANVDLVIASGFEAGGHRPGFLHPAEDSLHGTFSLVRQLSEKIRKPIIAAGGIVDAKGVKAALELGASGVQVGTAFLACEESGASKEYRDVLFSERANYTSLTKVFTSRLARGISGSIAAELGNRFEVLPFPLQTTFMAPLRKAAVEQGKYSLLTYWAGQNVSLIRHRNAKALMADLSAAFEN